MRRSEAVISSSRRRKFEGEEAGLSRVVDAIPLLAPCAESTPDQLAEWLMPALQMKIFGCLAQTELGHGSNVRGLLTTATYDPGKATHALTIIANHGGSGNGCGGARSGRAVSSVPCR